MEKQITRRELLKMLITTGLVGGAVATLSEAKAGKVICPATSSKDRLLYRLLPPNLLWYRDTLYIQYENGQTLSIDLLSRLAKAIDDYLNGRISELVIETDYIDVKIGIQQAKLLATGLAAEYLFYEGSGTTLHDTSGNGNNGTIYNPVWETLPNGKYYVNFDSLDRYTEIPNSTYINLREKLIIESIIRPHKLPVHENHYVFKYETYIAWVFPDGALTFRDNLGNGVNTTTRPIELNKWYHVVNMFIGSNGDPVTKDNCRIYVNTVNQPTTIVGTSWIAKGSTDPLYIPDHTSYKLYGDIALTRIFDYGKLKPLLDAAKMSIDDFVSLLYKLAKIMVPELGS